VNPPVTSSQVLDLFATAYRESTDALADFLARYPEHAEELVDYAHELNLQRECAGERSITPEDELWIEAQVSRMSSARSAAVDPFANWQTSQYVEARKALGVPSAVLTAFRDRLVTVASVPLPFLDRLADVLKVAMPDLVAFLEGSPRLATNVAYKSDAAPGAPTEKVSFESILNQAGVSTDRVSALLEEDI
jgi:hypothetical protein